jgi:hypothetical protein
MMRSEEDGFPVRAFITFTIREQHHDAMAVPGLCSRQGHAGADAQAIAPTTPNPGLRYYYPVPAAIARDSEVTAAISALSLVYQPLDSDLTAIAALTTTAYGRGLLTLANTAALNNSLWALRSVSTSGSVAVDDDVVIATAALTLTLPAASDYAQGKRLSVVAAADGVTIEGSGSETINGELAETLYDGEALVLVSNGSSWRVS